MPSPGMKLLSAVVQNGSTSDYYSLNLQESLFDHKELEFYKYLSSFIDTVGKVPAVETANEFLQDFGEQVEKVPEPPKAYLAEVENRYLTGGLKSMFVKTKSLIMEESAEKAMQYALTSLLDLNMRRLGPELVDFRDASKLIKEDHVKIHTMGDQYGIRFGWPTLDEMSLGLLPGDVATIIGRPGMGKTFMMLYAALNAWYKQKKRVLFVSMEMAPLLLIQRIAAMHTHYNLGKLKTGQMSTKAAKKVFGILDELVHEDVPFHVVHGNLSATIQDIWTLARQLKPDAIYVDGAYLVKVADSRVSKWDRIGQVAEDFKASIATDLGIPVCASYQFSRNMLKKKSIEDIGLEDIYGSDVIGQVSSLVMGLFEDDNVETLNRRRVDILKGRSGETGKFDIYWDFGFMLFDECKEEEQMEDMSFI